MGRAGRAAKAAARQQQALEAEQAQKGVVAELQQSRSKPAREADNGSAAGELSSPPHRAEGVSAVTELEPLVQQNLAPNDNVQQPAPPSAAQNDKSVEEPASEDDSGSEEDSEEASEEPPYLPAANSNPNAQEVVVAPKYPEAAAALARPQPSALQESPAQSMPASTESIAQQKLVKKEDEDQLDEELVEIQAEEVKGYIEGAIDSQSMVGALLATAKHRFVEGITTVATEMVYKPHEHPHRWLCVAGVTGLAPCLGIEAAKAAYNKVNERWATHNIKKREGELEAVRQAAAQKAGGSKDDEDEGYEMGDLPPATRSAIEQAYHHTDGGTTEVIGDS